jgi:hypothetical protein
MIRDWRLGLAALAWLGLAHAAALAQQQPAGGTAAPTASSPTTPPTLTIMTVPKNVRITLSGPPDLAGDTPLDLPPTVTGRFSVVSRSPGFARTQGVVYIPPRGQLPFLLSEKPGISTVLIFRGLNVPGVGDISCGHEYRGIALATAAAGGTFGAIRSQLFYRDRLDEVGDYAASRAENYKDARNSWLIYTGAVWGVSALDYWIRPRFGMAGTAPTSLTLEVPKVTRGSVVWRSLLVAGAGQEYAGHRTRALIWLSGLLGSGAGYVVANYQVDYGKTQVQFAQQQVDSAGPSEEQDAQLQLEQAQSNLQASYDLRHGFAWAMIGFQALSLFDAAIMQIALPAPAESKISATIPITPDGPAVLVSYHF